MATPAQLKRVEDLLKTRYGLGLGDVDQRRIVKSLDEGEMPEAIVDEIGEKYGLTRIDSPNDFWNSWN